MPQAITGQMAAWTLKKDQHKSRQKMNRIQALPTAQHIFLTPIPGNFIIQPAQV